jgi:alkanesulfonate monooxygenase SsuD/methylene tetrahydromethanopterin reductase-like flavin-dependent oxidoreductase (luciferase family)
MRLNPGVQLLPQEVTWPEWRDAWLRVDELGFETNWSYDHVHAPRGHPSAPCFEGWMGMAALGALAHRARVGMAVSGVRYRNPALLVKMATTLDHVTGGRTIFGLGAGWHQNEHEAYGWGFPGAGERVGRLEEALRITHLLWDSADGGPVDFEGRYYRLKGAYCRPRPLQTPHPPIMVAGGGPRLLRLVARYADWWDTWAPIDEARARRAQLAQACAEIGRDVRDITWSVSADFLYDRSPSRLAERVEAAIRVANRDPAFVRGRMLLGDSAALRDQVAQLAEAGVDHLLLHVPPPYDLEGLERFAHDVMPG